MDDTIHDDLLFAVSGKPQLFSEYCKEGTVPVMFCRIDSPFPCA
jgi:hypothetical protein